MIDKLTQYGKIDVVIGGPPCQGFSNANRQRNHAISQNNMLVKQYIRAVSELQPMAFVMENVSMLRSDVHRFYLDKDDAKIIDSLDINVISSSLILLDKQYMFEGALDLIADYNKIIEQLWPEKTYHLLNVIFKASKNPEKLRKALKKYSKQIIGVTENYENIPSNDEYLKTISYKAFAAIKSLLLSEEFYYSDLVYDIEQAIMIQRMLSKAKEIYDNNIVVDKYDASNGLCAIIRSYAVYDYIKAILESSPNNYIIESHVMCAADFGAPQKRMRFVLIGIKKSLTNTVSFPKPTFNENSYRTVYDAISDLENVPVIINTDDDIGTPITENYELSDLGRSLRNSKKIYNHIVTNTTDIAMERFKALKQGQNFHSLDEALKTNTYTDVSRTQNTIYLRLNYNQPSGTVVNVRKSMWVHPVLDRAISVREAARLQTFPDKFVFRGTKDKQYQQVGNAVPPILAKAIAKKLASQLSKFTKKN